MSMQPPPGMAYLAVINPTLNTLLIGHTFIVLFIALLFCLFFFSTAHSRSKPIFSLNVFAILLALVTGVLVDYDSICTIIYPKKSYPFSFNIAIGILGFAQSIFVDVILLLRVLIIYPLAQTGRYRFILIISLPVLLKIARIVNIVLFIRALVRVDSNSSVAAMLWSSAPYIKIEWGAQLVDNTYASTLFLWKLWLGYKTENSVDTGNYHKVSIVCRIRELFYIALTNFVFPACFSLVQMVVIFLDVDVIVINEIVQVNTSIAVIGVVFATVWTGTVNSSWLARGRQDCLDARVERAKLDVNLAVSSIKFADIYPKGHEATRTRTAEPVAITTFQDLDPHATQL